MRDELMRHAKLEKSIKKIDKDIEALKIATRYLSNLEEINEAKESLNIKRLEMARELYKEDSIAYNECREDISEMLNVELGKEKQKELLEKIKEAFGRQSPNPSKQSVGLNAWLKELDVECEWIEGENEEWAILVLKDLGTRRK